MIGDYDRGQTARRILAVRATRQRIFPSELFDEFAWNMLLILFAGHVENEEISERLLLSRSGAGQTAGRRWIGHLVADGQVADRRDDDDVVLTPDCVTRMRLFLDQAYSVGDDGAAI